EKLSGERERAFGIGAVIERLLEEHRLVPGDAVNGQVSDAGLLRRKRKLLQDRQQSRQHFLFAKAGKPDTQIKAVRHKSREAIVNVRCKLCAARGNESAVLPLQVLLPGACGGAIVGDLPVFRKIRWFIWLIESRFHSCNHGAMNSRSR